MGAGESPGWKQREQQQIQKLSEYLGHELGKEKELWEWGLETLGGVGAY